MGQEEIDKVSSMLNVKSLEVQNMESGLTGGDLHLNQNVDNESESDLMDLLQDERQNPEELYEDFNDKSVKRNYIKAAIDSLNDREKFIVSQRKLIESPRTLESLGAELSLSKERVRQLEAAAFGKMRKYLEKNAGEVKNFLKIFFS